MRNKLSLYSIFLISIIVVAFHFSPINNFRGSSKVVTTWDAFGYYLYLPSIFIYHDFKELAWLPKIDEKYSVSGGKLYQANRFKNGNYVFKYLGGVAILESPFFFMGHIYAKIFDFPTDGFSPPYQVSIAFGAMTYFILSLFLLRIVLLKYFDETVSALALLLLVLASNIIQYVSIDSAMSHSYIFPLYVLIIYFTIKWHEKPNILSASIIGAIIGLASICRPTELIMLFIPLLWNTQTKLAAVAKWHLVKQNLWHLNYLLFFSIVAIMPQLIYWKLASGSFIFDVGSKWEFANPHFRVLFGWEKGWFIYTPVAIFFIAGMFFMKNYPFKKSVLTFCLLNMYIIIAWHDWRYGASYSTRALSQSYAVFALPLATFINKIKNTHWRYLFYILSLYLISVNLFQIWQYNKNIIHYDDMNKKYYLSIYLNANPTPLKMSLLDTDEMLSCSKEFSSTTIFNLDSLMTVKIPEYSSQNLFEYNIKSNYNHSKTEDEWVKINSTIKLTKLNIWGCYLNSELIVGDSIKHNKIRLINAISPLGNANNYAFYVKIPPYFSQSKFKLFLSSSNNFEALIKSIRVEYLVRK